MSQVGKYNKNHGDIRPGVMPEAKARELRLWISLEELESIRRWKVTRNTEPGDLARLNEVNERFVKAALKLLK